MSNPINDFFSDRSPKRNFFKVIPLHQSPDANWDFFSSICSSLPKGWFELCELTVEDKVQFTFDYWMSKLAYRPGSQQFLTSFFKNLEDVGVYVIQQRAEEPFEAQMVYSLKGGRGFYRGYPPATEEDIINLQKLFPNYILPEDYKIFLQIHDGFCKTTDISGIIGSRKMKEKYGGFLQLIDNLGPVRTEKGIFVNPNSLIPFYESFGMPYYQCFWGDWYPEQEMGNVYYSSSSNTIAEVYASDPSRPERLTFTTFTDWLVFYLEQIEE